MKSFKNVCVPIAIAELEKLDCKIIDIDCKESLYNSSIKVTFTLPNGEVKKISYKWDSIYSCQNEVARDFKNSLINMIERFIRMSPTKEAE